MDSPALIDCLAVSISDEVVLEGDDPQSVEGQDSAKTGCSSALVNRRSRCSNSFWLAGLRVRNCGLGRCFERSGLKAVFFSLFDRGWLRDGWECAFPVLDAGWKGFCLVNTGPLGFIIALGRHTRAIIAHTTGCTVELASVWVWFMPVVLTELDDDKL